MKKTFMTPDVRIVRFESKDIIVTSDQFGIDSTKDPINNPDDINAQSRHSIWD